MDDLLRSMPFRQLSPPPQMCPLEDLHLWRCGLTDEAAGIVMDAEPPRLRLLNLAANPFSSELRGRLIRHKGAGALALSIRV